MEEIKGMTCESRISSPMIGHRGNFSNENGIHLCQKAAVDPSMRWGRNESYGEKVEAWPYLAMARSLSGPLFVSPFHLHGSVQGKWYRRVLFNVLKPCVSSEEPLAFG
jgi:hypothetical protein